MPKHTQPTRVLIPLTETIGDEPATQRAIEEVRTELDALKDAHLENETARDAFLALAHTALFAASIAFVGDLAEHKTPHVLWLLMLAWSASVVGLCALTVSYAVASRQIRRRHDQVYEASPDESGTADPLNAVALWSFPIALISTFLFAAVNVSHMTQDRPPPPRPPAAPEPITRGVTPTPRAPNPNTGVTPAPRVPAPPPPAPPPPPPPKD